MAVDQDTLNSATKGSLNSEPLILRDFNSKGAAITKAQAGVEAANAEAQRLQQQRGEEVTPMRNKIADMAQNSPDPTKVQEEQIPEYQRPKLDPKELQQDFGLMMTAAMLVGSASRTPYYGMMGAMSGVLDGFVKRDDAIVKESLQTFDKNLQSIKARNEQKREELNRAMSKYSNDMTGLKIALDNIAAKYDDPIAAAQLRTKSLQDSIKYLEQGSQRDLQLLQRMDQLKMHAQDMAERRAARAAASGAGNQGISEKYKNDPEYKKVVDYWAKYMANGNALPPRFAQSGAGKAMFSDIVAIAPTLGTPESVQANVVDRQRQNSEARAIGTKSAQVAMAAQEAKKVMPILEQASAAYPRTSYPKINEVINAYEHNTGDPKIRQFGAALNSFVNVYARAISPGGTPTVSDKEHAREMLNTADSHEALKAVLSTMQQEIDAAIASPAEAQKDLRKSIEGGGKEGKAVNWADLK